MPVSDAALWEAIQRGEAAAFAALYDRYWRRTFAAAYARTGDQVVCEEIVQDIFLTLWTERARLQIAAFPGYLAAAARYQAARYRRAADASPLRYADTLDTLSTDAAHNHGEHRLLHCDYTL